MASLGDFDALVSTDPKFASAWTEINGQLSAEGLDTTGAKIALTDSFEQLVSQGFGLQEDEAISAAKEYVKTGQTILGAVNTVKGLIDAQAAGFNPVQVTQAFTGTLIGLGGAAGVVSAGVGAAIVGAVGALLAILQQQGLFGSQPSGFQICPGIADATSKPDFVVGCLGMWGSAVSPGSVNWRTFPDPNAASDAPWFATCPDNGCDTFDWKGASYGNHLLVNPAGVMRPIDYAFEQYSAIEYLSANQTGPAYFTPGFVSAWKANAEYALNGLNACPTCQKWTESDAKVLVHFLRMWNRSHGPPALPFAIWAPGTFFGRLVDFAKNDLQPGDPILTSDNSDLFVNAGFIKTAASVASPAKRSTAGKVATIAVAAPATVLFGSLVYAWATGRSVELVLSHLWSGAKRFAYRVAGDIRTPLRRTNPLELFERQATTVQSLLFPRSSFDARSAKSWARSHGYRASKTHVIGGYVRVRQHPPGEFVRSSFRTIPFGSGGIKAVIGHLR
jgi:hypothetical protein